MLQFLALFGSAVMLNFNYWQYAVARVKPILDMAAFSMMVMSYDSASSLAAGVVDMNVLAALEADIMTILLASAFSIATLMINGESWLQT